MIKCRREVTIGVSRASNCKFHAKFTVAAPRSPAGVPIFGGGEASFEKVLYPEVRDLETDYVRSKDIVGIEVTIGAKGGLIGQLEVGQGSIEIPNFHL